MPKPTPSPPPSAGKLEKYVLAAAREYHTSVPRIRQWVSFMVISGALDRVPRHGDGPTFLVKGGVALALRLRLRARVTEDLDVVAFCANDDPLQAIDDALAEPYEGFMFSRRPQTRALGAHAIRTVVKITYRGHEWATVQIDVTHPDPTNIEHERIAAIPLTYFGFNGPVDVPCLSLRYHIAQKWHGLTRHPPSGGPNERFRDAVDLLLLRELVHDLRVVRAACEETFAICAEQSWPPVLQFPESWRGPFLTLAGAVNLPVTDLSVAEEQLRTFLQDITNAS